MAKCDMCFNSTPSNKLDPIKEVWSPNKANIEICPKCSDLLNQELDLARADMVDRVKTFVAANMKTPPKYKPANTWVRKLLHKKIREISLL